MNEAALDGEGEDGFDDFFEADDGALWGGGWFIGSWLNAPSLFVTAVVDCGG